MKFDVIVGNPPYNSPREAGTGSTNVLWPTFTRLSLEMIKINGYLLFIHPPPWRKPGHDLWRMMVENQIHFIKIFSLKKSTDIFGAGTRSDYYCLQKTKCIKESIIVDEDGNECSIRLNDFPFLPNRNIMGVYGLLAKKDEPTCPVLYDTKYHGVHTKKTKSGEYKNEVIQKITRSGPMMKFSDRCDGHYGEGKVIVNEGGRLYPINDVAGKYAMSQSVFGILTNDQREANDITSALSSKKFDDEIIQSTKWSLFRTDYRMFLHFRKDFYKSFL